MGTDLHQMTISNLRLGINELARSRRTRDEPLPWQALSQITLLGCVHPDGLDFTTYPDIFVYPHPISQNRGSVALVTDGPPVLIIEVLSESTYRWDLDLERGKGYSYAQAGVREYLALDPTGAFVAEGGRGWRLVDGTYRPWEQDANGRWQSEQIAVAIGLEGVLAAAYSPEGRRVLREGEIEAELARRDAELARREAEITRLQRLLDEQRNNPSEREGLTRDAITPHRAARVDQWRARRSRTTKVTSKTSSVITPASKEIDRSGE